MHENGIEEAQKCIYKTEDICKLSCLTVVYLLLQQVIMQHVAGKFNQTWTNDSVLSNNSFC